MDKNTSVKHRPNASQTVSDINTNCEEPTTTKMNGGTLKAWKLERGKTLVRKINGVIVRELLHGESPLIDLPSTEAANLALSDVRQAALLACLKDNKVAASLLTYFRAKKAVEALAEALKAHVVKS
jgi:hypothetical protein